MAILVTGAAGFIGMHAAHALLARGEEVIGVDSLNDYYDPALKQARLARLQAASGFTFLPIDIADRDAVAGLAARFPTIDRILHLAAQAGVRYSLENPFAYVDSNLVGQVTIMELARRLAARPDGLRGLVYASSSSVYGANRDLPYAVEQATDSPVSFYGATKKAGEILVQSYAHLYGVAATGLRFFTVYGPWGRPDMSPWLFTSAIIEGHPIKVFNNGRMKRDFTYIDDIVAGVLAALDHPPAADDGPPHRVYNLGNHRPVNLLDYIAVIERACQKKAVLDLHPMQPGDVLETYADIDASARDLGFAPTTAIEEGSPRFVDWYKSYFNV
ncbi:MAG: SDR family NAD(P)-dependent oxidoreductase [Pseudomonadota bacterium]|nr:SDR family NAD(P)-dependent oxidoreductase [Pseudomonadota bacterium]